MTFRLTSTPHFLTIEVADDTNVPYLLDVLGAAGTRATFFIPASLAVHKPQVTRALVRGGHEIAALGMAHLAWDVFRSGARETKDVLEQASGAHVRGHRAERGALGPRTPWAFEILAEEGFEYDSTCVPEAKPGKHGKTPGVPDYPYAMLCGAGSLIELPITRLDLFGRTLASRERAGLPAIVALATMDLDESRPRRLPALLHGRRATRDRVARLVRDFRFEAIGHRLGELSFGAPATFAA